MLASKAVSTGALWLAITCISAAFGKTMFTFFLQRTQLTSTTTTTTNIDAAAIVTAVKTSPAAPSPKVAP
jgi:hypothetical protein